jgi:ABC-type glutathione transport system ATPase component
VTPDTADSLLAVRGLTKHFHRGVWPRKQTIVAVDNIDLHVARGESVGLVGESGSGKTTTARAILRLVDPTAGEISFDGIRVDETPRGKVRRLYRDMQMVFQDPNSSLNPRMTVREVVTEPLKLHLKMSKQEQEERANEIMTMVGMRGFHLDRYPGQLSGGQRQRVGVGRAIATHPKLVFLDEPTSSLDVSVRGQVMQLLVDLQRKLNMSYVLISHDLGVVRQLSRRVMVMFNGRIVEEGPTQQVFEDPSDDYTKKLLAAIPSMDGYRRRRQQGGSR